MFRDIKQQLKKHKIINDSRGCIGRLSDECLFGLSAERL